MLAAPLAKAGMIGLEDIDPEKGSVAEQGYAGFQWDSRWTLGNTASLTGFSGVASDGVWFLYNAGRTSNLAISRTTPFDFLGLYLATPNSRTERTYEVAVTAYDDNDQLIGTTDYLEVGTSPLWVGTNFTSVSRLVIDSFGGVFTIDGLHYRDIPARLSEAGALALFAIGLLGLWAARRRTS